MTPDDDVDAAQPVLADKGHVAPGADPARVVPGRRLLAVDLGLRAGFACFDCDGGGTPLHGGQLLWARSQHFATVTVMKRAVAAILTEAAPAPHTLAAIIVEGDRHYGDIWMKAAARRGASTFRVAPETWRRALLLPRQQRHGADAKAAAYGIADEAFAAGPAKRPRTRIKDDVAEAICIGVYGLGLLQT